MLCIGEKGMRLGMEGEGEGMLSLSEMFYFFN